MNLLSVASLANMFSHSVGCLIILLMVYFVVQNLFSLVYSHLFNFTPVSLVLGDTSVKILLRVMSKILLPMFSFRIFMVSGLIFTSFAHFEFILVYSVRRWFNSIFLHVSVQFSQHHLLNKLSLAYFMCLLSLLNINWLWRYGFISGFSILFHWSMHMLLCQYHVVLITMVL